METRTSIEVCIDNITYLLMAHIAGAIMKRRKIKNLEREREFNLIITDDLM